MPGLHGALLLAALQLPCDPQGAAFGLSPDGRFLLATRGGGEPQPLSFRLTSYATLAN